MATSRITDNEMRYFQFKAQQLFLLQKENYEWEEFCKQNAFSCSSYSAEKYDKKTVKDVGIQAASKTLTNSGRNVVLGRSDHESGFLPEALNFIKAKLERIDLALSEIKTVSTENEKVVKTDQQIPGTFSTIWSSPNGSRKQLIQESLRQSLQRLQSSAVFQTKQNPSTNIKWKNSSYMIPHALQKQRIAARKAYLASLPKTQRKSNLSSAVSQKKSTQIKMCQQKSPSMKNTQKTRKKKVIKHKKAEAVEPSLVATDTPMELKDENIEIVVDNILEDLVGETVLVLNTINQRKGRKLNFPGITAKKPEIENEVIGKKPSIQLHPSKTLHELISDEDTNIKQNFSDKTAETTKITSNAKQTNEDIKSAYDELDDLEGDTTHLDDNRNSEEPYNSEKTNSHFLQHLPSTELKKHLLYSEKRKELSIDPKIAEEIIQHRNQFLDYLENIARVEKGNFNPWILSNTIAEVLLDECIQDISQELGAMSSSVITALYNQEFLKSV